VWFQQVHQPYVTPGNRAAAVIASFNIVIFTTIAVLARREKRIKARSELVPVEPDNASDKSSKVEDKSHSVVAVHPKAVEAHGTSV
jgi:ACS family pantothenate transporter-like MFS transporter